MAPWYHGTMAAPGARLQVRPRPGRCRGSADGLRAAGQAAGGEGELEIGVSASGSIEYVGIYKDI